LLGYLAEILPPGFEELNLPIRRGAERIDEVEVGHTYTLEGEELRTLPATTEEWSRCEANYRVFDGWPEVDWSEVAGEGYEALPENARTYVEYIEDELDTPAYAIGVGPGRGDTVVRERPF